MQCSTPMYKSKRTAELNGSMRRRVASRFAIVLALLATAAVVACDMPHAEAPEESGSVLVTIESGDSLGALTLLPDTSMEPEEYRITGNGPSGASFETWTSGGSSEIQDLRLGEWQIETSAFNVDEEEIGYGNGTVAVENGQTAELNVVLRALTGIGSLSLSVVWPAEEVENGEIAATLASSDGHSESLAFEPVVDGEASFFSDEIDAGYYTLILQLLEDDHVVAGAVDTVRIVQDGLTEGTFSFADLNHPTGDIDIIVVPDMDEPLEVAITGGTETLSYGESMTVSAEVENAGDSTLEYTWYLNGAAVGSEASLTVGDGLSPGSYRLDVVVFTEDGQRSGSDSHNFAVE